MNYLIKIYLSILFVTFSTNANETKNNKILFKLNNEIYTNIDLEKRIEYIEKTNNIKYENLDNNSKNEVFEDFISSLIFFEYSKINKIEYKNLINERDIILNSLSLNYENNSQETNDFKNNITIDLVRKKILEDFINSRRNFLSKETTVLDLIYNYNVQYLIINKKNVDNSTKNIKNRNEFLNFKKELEKNKIPFLFKNSDILDTTIITDELKIQIKNNSKITYNNNENFLKIISIEKTLESYEGIYVKLISYRNSNKLDKNYLNCNYISNLKEKIQYKEYEYEKLNNKIKNNLKSINDYILSNDNGIYNYIFLCDLRYDEKILNQINFNKKVNNLVNTIQSQFLKKYKKEYNLIIL